MKPLSADKHWFVLRTNIKCEEKATRNLRKVSKLRNAGFEVYYPRKRVERKNKRTHTKHTIEMPLLMRYIFIGMPVRGDQHFGFARACEGVEDFLRNNQRPLRIPFELIEKFYIDEVNMKFDETEQARKFMQEKFAPGTTHMVSEGPFEGMIAEVRKLSSSGDVTAMVKLFGGLATIHVKTDKLAAAA